MVSLGLANIAADAYVPLALDTLRVQVQLVPGAVDPPTLSDLLTVKSGAVTVTVSLLQVLLVWLLWPSPGYALQIPPVGLVNVPVALGWAAKVTVKYSPAGMVTEPPEAEQVRVLLAMPQLIVPKTRMLLFTGVMLHPPGYVMLVPGRLSTRMGSVLLNDAVAVPLLVTLMLQCHVFPKVVDPMMSSDLVATRSGAGGVTTTVSLQVLLAVLLSAGETAALGSTMQTGLVPLGLTNVFAEPGVAGMDTVKNPPFGPMITSVRGAGADRATQSAGDDATVEPAGRVSVRMVAPIPNVAGPALLALATVMVQVQPFG